MRWLPVVLLITATFLMGSSFVIGKMGLAYAPPLMLTAYRFLIGGGLLLAVVLWKMKRWPSFATVWRAAVIGAFQTTGVMACIFISMKTISAGESSILTFTNPIFVLVLSSLLLKERYRLRQWFGVLLGLLGVSFVLSAELSFNYGMWIGLLSGILWSFATLLVKRWAGHFTVWLLSGLQMTFGGLLLWGLSILSEHEPGQWNAVSISILLWLAIPGSIVQFGLWYMLLSRMEPSRASSFLFLAPVFGVLTGAWWLHEPLGVGKLVGGLMVFAGIFLANFKGGVERAGAE
ncbi:DMT family transporter [Paenibacillus cremeus]|uniref:EamA family transporter n=1 Tax=Paenibacillus cremeus TaxID=2163881 RepID=A0A559KIL9_9BACL|nr:DMT family transporter [Paenibacillus cremeus]TVY11990.1 EamA family transporter [Paenibacillus cremeus]